MRMNKVIYPVVFTGTEQNKLDKLKGFSKIGYKSELIAKHILEQNPSITSCSFIRGKKNMYLGDIRVRMQGYKKDQARYIEVKTGTLYEGRKKLCIDYKYTIKNCPDIEYRQSTTEPWINASYDTWLLSLDLDTYLDFNNIKYKRIAYELINPKRVE